ncbi:hypothetical protein GE09DRAFT_1228225 [Coniochaeta sp. 2T2.1]|nr:hypothetical protein GE09DRAFT_1228225 [Coniochaeta sp. 2T2.1]
MAITSAINDLVASIYELFASVVGGIYSAIHAVFAAVFGLFSGFVNLFADIFKGAFDVVGGLGKFLASNIVIVAIIALGGYAFVRYQNAQGRPAVPQKKVQ